MLMFDQDPTDPAFGQNPYPVYAGARQQAPLHYWPHYRMVAAFDFATVNSVLRDRRFGRQVPPELAETPPAHLKAFYAVEAHSMLELEPPAHTRLRTQVLRAFTTRRVSALQPEIEALCDELIAAFPGGPFDLITTYCTAIPVRIIARLLGVPEGMAPQLLDWSHAMVAMYQANRTRAMEDAANRAAQAFSAFILDYVETRRAHPADDLITHLIAAETDGERLSTSELITTCILLLNAGHEATVHMIGNAVKTLLEHQADPALLSPERVAGTVEELTRFDPPLHMFTRYVYEKVTLHGHTFQRGDQIALLLGAANRDPAEWDAPDTFSPTRPAKTHTSFGAGLHFCVGAPLARLELQIALAKLFSQCPTLRLTETPIYANTYHFHGLEQLEVTL
ncbi:cytochrome P450 [Thalassococcus sp. S3]|uniref:cytochrome P450 n=1 Tax=Thalassococcus sp. S3 TaxID=2017482 RepID=UPI0010243CE3|nr:cytochrome P450 [Thalassococcus sp. S3]QBF31428.1 cytochrome P450 [Thalassococcus sp. S3]